MNFYKHHIGDYAAATAHLSWDEDMAYSRLLRWYYQHEKPLPADQRALYRLTRAQSKPQREAVDAVLEEFFTLEDDGWHQKRCDEELARASAQAEANRRVAADREERRRAAMDRRTNRSDSEHESCNESLNESSASREPSQTPDSRLQTKAVTQRADSHLPARPLAPVAQTAAGRACRLMRDAGCASTNPAHPDLLAALDEGVTPEALAETVREAVEQGARKPFAYAIATARGRHADGARQTNGASRGTDQPRESLVDRNARRAAEILGRTGTE